MILAQQKNLTLLQLITVFLYFVKTSYVVFQLNRDYFGEKFIQVVILKTKTFLPAFNFTCVAFH